MIPIKILVFFAILMASTTWGKNPKPSDEPISDPAEIRAFLAAQPVRQVAYWKDNLSRPLPMEKKISDVAPAEMIEFLNYENQAQGFSQEPKAFSVPPELKQKLVSAIQGIPLEVRNLVNPHLLGIYLVTGLGSSAFSDTVPKKDGSLYGGFIVLDAGVLSQKSNAWAAWKESSPFTQDPLDQLEAKVEEPLQDISQNTFQYILMHELGHLLAASVKVHPDWQLALTGTNHPARFEFSKLSWELGTTGRFRSLFDSKFPQRANMLYYAPKDRLLPASQMKMIYENIERTNFPTLYAATNPADDFAESFANYIHVVLEKRPFEIKILHAGQEVKRYHACWEEPRCQEKRKLIEGMLKNPERANSFK